MTQAKHTPQPSTPPTTQQKEKIMLRTFTTHSRNKAVEAAAKMGKPSLKQYASYSTLNKFFNGIGFSTETIRKFGKADMIKAYRSADSDLAVPFADFAPFVAAQCGVGAEFNNAMNEIPKRYNEIAVHAGLPQVVTIEQKPTPTPTPEKDETEMPAPAKKEVTVWEAIPAEKPAAPDSAESVKELGAALVKVLQGVNSKAPEIDESRVVELIKKHAMATTVTIQTPDEIRNVPTGLHHKALPLVLKMISAGVNVLMVGAAGSGKTTIAEQVAQALELDFYFNGALSSEYKLSGFVDAQGRIVSTAFRRAYEFGGVYLFDEIDASMPDALLAFNAALANGHADFPDGSIKRHPNFRCIAAANTYGKGADRVYVGRNQLDGASLDRFCVIDIDYDEKLERALASNDNWVDYVQKIRNAIYKLKIRHIVSPRASLFGAKLLAAGLSEREVEDAAIWKGLDADSKNKIRLEAGV